MTDETPDHAAIVGEALNWARTRIDYKRLSEETFGDTVPYKINKALQSLPHLTDTAKLIETLKKLKRFPESDDYNTALDAAIKAAKEQV